VACAYFRERGLEPRVRDDRAVESRRVSFLMPASPRGGRGGRSGRGGALRHRCDQRRVRRRSCDETAKRFSLRLLREALCVLRQTLRRNSSTTSWSSPRKRRVELGKLLECATRSRPSTTGAKERAEASARPRCGCGVRNGTSIPHVYSRVQGVFREGWPPSCPVPWLASWG
jgi:hypothetical protein